MFRLGEYNRVPKSITLYSYLRNSLQSQNKWLNSLTLNWAGLSAALLIHTDFTHATVKLEPVIRIEPNGSRSCWMWRILRMFGMCGLSVIQLWPACGGRSGLGISYRGCTQTGSAAPAGPGAGLSNGTIHYRHSQPFRPSLHQEAQLRAVTIKEPPLSVAQHSSTNLIITAGGGAFVSLTFNVDTKGKAGGRGGSEEEQQAQQGSTKNTQKDRFG